MSILLRLTSLRRLSPLLLSFAACCAGADLIQIRDTRASYSLVQEPGTSINRSVVRLRELNDTTGRAALEVHCALGPKVQAGMHFTSRHKLVRSNGSAVELPRMTVQLSGENLVPIHSGSFITQKTEAGDMDEYAVGISPGYTRYLTTGLANGRWLVVHIFRPGGGPPLKYTFNPKGFDAAWHSVLGCEQPDGKRQPTGAAG